MTVPALITRLVAALLALMLLLGGVLAALEIVLAQLNRPPLLTPHETWAEWLRERTFDATVVRAILVGLVVLGLLLLIPSLWRGRPTSLPLPGQADGVQVRASRRGVEKTLAAAARRTGGVRAASAKVGRRTVTVTARTATRSQSELQQRVTAAVTERLTDLGLADSLRPRVRVSHREAR